MRRRLNQVFASVVVGSLILIGLTLAPPTHATRVRPLNLDQMTERASRVFSGRCVEVTYTLDPELGREVVLVTFEVERAVKGEMGATVQIRVLPADEGRGQGVDGVPGFEPGEEVVLFLYGESAVGLTSPVGFGQGKFTVQEDKSGNRVAINAYGNRNLFKGLSSAASEHLGDVVPRGRETISPTDLLDGVELLLSDPTIAAQVGD